MRLWSIESDNDFSVHSSNDQFGSGSIAKLIRGRDERRHRQCGERRLASECFGDNLVFLIELLEIWKLYERATKAGWIVRTRWTLRAGIGIRAWSFSRLLFVSPVGGECFSLRTKRAISILLGVAAKRRVRVTGFRFPIPAIRLSIWRSVSCCHLSTLQTLARSVNERAEGRRYAIFPLPSFICWQVMGTEVWLEHR